MPHRSDRCITTSPSRRRGPGGRVLVGLAVVSLGLGLAACGGDDAGSSEDPPATAPSDTWDEAAADAARARAEALLGTPEDDLPDDVRIGRRGDEDFALTMDLVPGRLTAELDDDGSGGAGFVVTSVTLETPDGSERFGD